VGIHAEGLVAKPYKCEHCGKRHATPKQRNSHKEGCKRSRDHGKGDIVEFIDYYLDQVEGAIQTDLLITPQGVSNAMNSILTANKELG